jgi:hypothetical protein
MRTSVRRLAPVVACALPSLLAPLLAGCGQSEDPYKAIPAFSGKKASMPAVPTLPAKPVKIGDAYTVYGATHHLRSRVHTAEVNGKELSLTGYVVKTNFADAPACAVHKTGKGDKEDCKAQIPAFWIADEKGEDKATIKVMGFASNFAQCYDAIEKYNAPNPGGKPVETVKDEFWASELPNPMPNVGAKATVQGTFGISFTKATGGVETDPDHGILTLNKITYIEPPPEPALLPGMKLPNQPK